MLHGLWCTGLTHPARHKVSAMAFDANGSCLLTGGHDGQIKMWNLSNGKLLKEFVKPVGLAAPSSLLLKVQLYTHAARGVLHGTCGVLCFGSQETGTCQHGTGNKWLLIDQFGL